MSSASDQIQMNHNDPNPEQSEGRSKFRNNTSTSIDDLSDSLLAEIVCRLPCNKFVFRCKGVSKRWCTLVSDPHFIDRFVRLQSDRKIPIIRTLLNFEAEEFRWTMTVKEVEFLTAVNTKAEEFLAAVTTKGEELLPTDAVLIATTTKTLLKRMTGEVEKWLTRTPSKPLTPLFERLMSCHSLESEPFVVATYNDLVLCCASEDDQRDYFICNPLTIQWVPLPPPPRVYRQVAVGFILEVDNAQQSCRCKVVRIPEEIYGKDSFHLKAEIFSSETGRWKESIVSFTKEIDCSLVDPSMSYPYNGMLYWGLPRYGGNYFIGFDPFMINSTSSSDGSDHYKGRIIDFGDAPNSVETRGIVCVGVYGGCLRFISNLDLNSCTLHAWELEEGHDERARDRSGNLIILKCSKYSFDTQMFDGTEPMSYLYLWPIFDPNDEDILYLRNENEGNFKCNIRTGEWSKMQVQRLNDNSILWFQFITLPWWPTPIPRLAQDQDGNIPMEQASSYILPLGQL